MSVSRRSIVGLAGAVIALVSLQAGAANITVSTDITTTQSWSSNNVYTLTKPIFVRNGATLTIGPGTVIRGEKEVTTDPGALVVSRGAKIRAMGTAEAPIVMTDISDNLVAGSVATGRYASINNGWTERWGGLILLGETYIATGVDTNTPSPDCALELQIEGLEPFGEFSKYGGCDDDDDSGEVHFVNIRYGGFELGDANEINGLTMGAVGRGTEIDHVEVFQNKDDGFEFFGGTVNTKYMVVWMVGDDGFDWDEGFRGKGQFWLNVQGPIGEADKSDKGAEMDGAGGDSSQPSAIPTIYNTTYVGHGKGLLMNSVPDKNTPLHFRDGTGGRYFNSLFMDFPGACALIEGDPNSPKYEAADNFVTPYDTSVVLNGVPGLYNHEENGSMRGMIANSLFWNMGTNVAIGIAANTNDLGVAWGASTGDGDKPHYAYPLFTDGTLSNLYDATAPAWDGFGIANGAPVEFFARDLSITNQSKYIPVTSIDPRLPVGSGYLSGGRVPPQDGFFTGLTMKGAFGRRAWAAEWTTAAKLFGLDFDGAPFSNYDEFETVITDGYTTATIEFPTVSAVEYTIESSVDFVTWVTEDTLTGTGATVVWTDTSATVGEKFYRVTTAVTP